MGIFDKIFGKKDQGKKQESKGNNQLNKDARPKSHPIVTPLSDDLRNCVEKSRILLRPGPLYMHYWTDNLACEDPNDPSWQNKVVFFWKADEPFPKKSLPPEFETLKSKYFLFEETTANVTLQKGEAMPWFGMPGLGEKHVCNIDNKKVSIPELHNLGIVEYYEVVELNNGNQDLLANRTDCFFLINQGITQFQNGTFVANGQPISISYAYEIGGVQLIKKVKSEQIETSPVGIKINKVDNGDYENTWGAILGFKTLEANGREIRMEHYAACSSTTPVEKSQSYSEYELNSDRVRFVAVETPQVKLFFPAFTQVESLAFKTKEIYEWKNFHNQAAVIIGSGKDTFGLKFLATDYHKNSEKYKQITDHKVALGGFGYVLDKSDTDNSNDANLSDDFCAYMPHSDLNEFGCFDYIGEVVSVAKNQILENKSINGIVIKVKLINHPDIPNFFDLDIFYCEENLRVKEIEVGMRIAGMFQLTGRIVD